MLVLAFFFASDKDLGERLLTWWVPSRHQAKIRLIMEGLRRRLTRWVLAQVAVAIYFAFAFSIGLKLLGVPFAVTIGLIGGVLEIIPYLGGFIGFLFAVTSALAVDPWLALWVAIFYVVVTEIESHVIAPAFYGRVINLHPAVILVALLVGAKVEGILGVFFAVPIAVILAAILDEVRASFLAPEPQPHAQNSGSLAPELQPNAQSSGSP